jgi:uncharacterized membrane protein YqjE
LGGSLLALAEARVELVSIELAEESGRWRHLLVLAVTAAVFLLLALMMLSFLVVVLFWDSQRLAAVVAVVLLHSAVGAWAILRFRQLLHQSPPPFSATLAEFRKDLAMLRGRHE